MQCDDRCDVVFVTGFQNFSVVIDLGLRKLSVFRLDATPLHAEAIVVKTQLGEHRNVLWIQVVVIAGVSAWLFHARTNTMLPIPPIVIPVVAFHLVGGRCSTPSKSGRKRKRA